jgi:hypothetical protein
MPLLHPWILEGLGVLLLAMGAAGLVALCISQPLSPALKRTVATICAVMTVGGGLLFARAEALRDADRDLTPSELANLARAMSQFPDARFEVFSADTGNETRSLASKLADAVKTGTGNAPAVADIPPLMQKDVVPPVPQAGVVIVLRDREGALGRAVAKTIGRALMAARVACITDDAPELDDRTVRIVIGPKP